jgi:hypothetical protein
VGGEDEVLGSGHPVDLRDGRPVDDTL